MSFETFDIGPPKGVVTFPVGPPSTDEVLKAAAIQPGLDFIQGAGGALRGVGDLTGTRTLQDLGAELYRSSQGAADYEAPAGMTLPQQVGLGAVQSVGDMLPFLIASAATGGGAALPIVAGGVLDASQKYGELRQDNFSAGRSALHAIIDGTAESLGELIGLPVLYKGTSPFLHTLAEFTAKELAGEEFTTVAQQMNQMLSNKPDMTWQEFLDGLKMTALITPVAAVPQAGAVRVTQRLMQGAGGPPVVAPTAGEQPNVQQTVQPDTAPTPPTVQAPQTEAPIAPKPAGVEEFQLAPYDPAEAAKQAGIDFTKRRAEDSKAQAEKIADLEELRKANLDLFPLERQADATTDSPDDMLKKGHIDPVLYTGLFDQQTGRGSVEVSYTPGQGYSIQNRATRQTQVALTNDEAVRQLTQQTGVDLTQPEALRQAHMAATLTAVQRNYADSLSNSVLAYYGPQLKELIDKANSTTIPDERLPIGPLVDVWRNAWVSTKANVSNLGIEAPVTVQQVGSNQVSTPIAVKDLKGLPGNGGTFVLHRNMGRSEVVGVLNGLAKRVEVWRSTFAPSMKVAIANMSSTQNRQGQMMRMPDGSFILGLNLSAMGGMKPVTPLLMAHEFGHALVMHQLMQSEPSVALRFVNEWMDARGKMQDSQMEYIGKYGGASRLTTMEFVLEHGASVQPKWTQYQMSFDEFMADRVTDYLYRKDAIYSPSEKSFLQRTADVLKAFFEKFASKYQPSLTFDKWMNQLRGSRSLGVMPEIVDKPVDIGPAKEPIAPKKSRKAAQKVLIDDLLRQPLPIPTPEQVKQSQNQERLQEEGEAVGKQRENAVRRAMSKFMSADEIKAFENADGSLDFEEAFKFLDTMGVDTAKWMDTVNRRDDTTDFRGQVSALTLNFPDLKPHIINSNEATKNFNWFLQKTLTAVQIRKRYGGSVPGAKAFVDTMELMHAYRSRWKSRADDRIHDMRALSKADRERVFKLLFDEDTSGAYKTEVRKEADGTVTRIITPQIAKEYGITEAGGRLYNNLVKDFKTSLDELEELAKNEIYRNFSGGEPNVERERALAKAVQELELEFARMRNKPYVPHTRFGEYTVTVYGEKNSIEEFYQFESEREALKKAEELRGEGKTASAGRMREDIRAFLGLPPQLVASMKNSLNLDAEQVKQFEDLLKNLSSGQSFVRRMQRRKNVEGYAKEAQDYPRVYADYFSRFANHAARLKFNHQLTEAEKQVRGQIKDSALSAENTVNLGKLLNWMQRTHEWAVSPRMDMANIRAAVTLWYLGFGVKSAFVNSMSVPMVTAPYLSQRFGWTRGTAEITRAYRDLARYFTKNTALSQDELKMVAHLRSIGVLDESLSAQLAGIREGGTLSDLTSLGTLAGNFYRLKYYGMWMFHKIELVNRYSTALAAYRLARQQTTFDPNDLDGFDKKAATFAKLAVQDTQNENGQWNRAEMMRGGKSVFTMFLSYQQNLTYQMFGGDSSWMRLLAVQLVLAGMMGLPFAQDLDNLTKWFARKVLGDDASIDKAVRAFLQDTFIKPDVLLKGASYNVFGADLQGSLSMGQVIPGLDALAMEGDFNSRLANAAGDVGGAGFSAVLDIMKAIASNEPDSIRRFQRALPQAVRNSIQSYNMLTTGKAENPAGQTIADTDRMDAAMKLLGFQPTDVAQQSELRFVQKDAAQFWLTRREYVLAKYYRGLQSSDSDLVSAARSDLATYNSEVPAAGLRITTQALREALTKRFKGDAIAEKDLPGSKSNIELYRQQAALYGQ